MNIISVENFPIPSQQNVSSDEGYSFRQITELALAILFIVVGIILLTAGVYPVGAAFIGASIPFWMSICLGKKERELVHVDPVSQTMQKFHNPNISSAIVGVYISSNESNLENSSQVLLSHPRPVKSCHIGFSGWHNFDIMAQRQSDYGLICDFNPHNKKFIEVDILYLSIVKISPFKLVMTKLKR